MVDIEFIVQYLVLRFSYQYKSLLGNLGNIALLGIAANEGLIEQSEANEIAQAYRIYREHQHRIRLDGAEKTRIKPENMDHALLVSKVAVTKLWQKVLCA